MNDPTRQDQMKKLVGYFTGYMATHLIGLGVEVGIFQAIASPGGDGRGEVDAENLAARMGLDPRYLDYFLRAAYALELLDRTASGTYRLAPHMGVLLARPESASYFGSLPRLYRSMASDLDGAASFLRDGRTVPYASHDPALFEAVAESTRGISRFVVAAVVGSIPGFDRAGSDRPLVILDVGSGCGVNLVNLARAFPRARVIGVEPEPESAAKARARIEAEGLADRVEIQRKSGAAIDLESVIDLVTMIQVLHETPTGERDAVLGACARALKPGGHLVLVDEPMPADPAGYRGAPHTVLSQFVEAFWGNVFLSPEEQAEILRRAGLEIVHAFTAPPGILHVTVARRPAVPEPRA